MQMTQLRNVRPHRGIAPHDVHPSRWKLRLFTWPFWHRGANAGSLTSAGSVPLDHSVTSLLQECELHDEVLADARRRLAALEEDPETDELTLTTARHEIFRRKREIAQSFTS